MRLKAHDPVWIIAKGVAYEGEFLRYQPGGCVKTCSGKFGYLTWPRTMVKKRELTSRIKGSK